MGDFVRKQRAIPVNELSKDDTECFCCSTTYGQLQAEGLIEYAVILECSHILGSICLTKWLQYSNTCPHVSHLSFLGSFPVSTSFACREVCSAPSTPKLCIKGRFLRYGEDADCGII